MERMLEEVRAKMKEGYIDVTNTHWMHMWKSYGEPINMDKFSVKI